jgi:hypothetical protein
LVIRKIIFAYIELKGELTIAFKRKIMSKKAAFAHGDSFFRCGVLNIGPPLGSSVLSIGGFQG